MQYAAPPTWLRPAPTPTSAPSPDGLPVRVVFFDEQTRAGEGGVDIYSNYRLKVLTPPGLEVGNLTRSWNPSTDDLVVHSLKIIRGGHVIDVLAKNKFRVIERENNLAYAMLDGTLTATLQVPGLQVGDELEFATTLRRRDPTFGGNVSGGIVLPAVGGPGVYRVRLVWPKGEALSWRATPDLGPLTVQTRGPEREIVDELRDPTTSPLADGAPARFNIRRLVEFSEFRTWGDVAHALWPVFASAETLAPTSPIRAEVAKIASSAADPAARAEAALQLVQDRVRYVFVGLDGGAYRPATADETWSRRFGDCKAKTVLLIALLRQLGIESEAVLVNSAGGDGLDKRLPTPAAFDHVLVRIQIEGKTYWLDGTRQGDRRLTALPPAPSRWSLALREGPTDLAAITAEPPILPQQSIVLDVDASAGFTVPAKVREERAIRGDGVWATRTQLSSLSAEDAQRAVKAYIHEDEPWIDPATASWRYDEVQGTLILVITGEARPAWQGNDQNGHSLAVYNAGFAPPSELKRPKEQDQAAPWLTEFPDYKRWTTIIRLPPSTAKWQWSYSALPSNVRLGGVSYQREASLTDGVLRTTMSRRVYLSEITPDQAQEVNDGIASFDNNVSQVYQVTTPPSPPIDPDLAAASKIEDPKLLTAAGERLLLKQRIDEAIACFDKALSADPKFAQALAKKGDALADKNNFEGALKLFDAASAADPKIELRSARASALTKMGRKGDAAAIWDAIATTNPENSVLMYYAARGRYYAGDKDRGLAIVDEGLRASPGELHLLQLRSVLEGYSGRFDAALADADEVIRRQPEVAANFVNRAFVLSLQHRYSEALEDIEEAWRMAPLDEGILVSQTNLLDRIGRKAEEMEVLDSWAAWDKTGIALNSRCWARAKQNVDLAKAEIDCAAAVKAAPGVASYWDSYALVALRRDRLDEALERYGRALSLNPKLAQSLYGRGVVKLRQGDEVGGAADIAAARTIAPTAGKELEEAGVAPS